MTKRERFLATMTFGSPDRPASGDYFSYDSTRLRWEREGLPEAANLNEFFDMDFDPFEWKVDVNLRVEPWFERVILEDLEDRQIVRGGEGEVFEVLKNSPPPAMPRWLGYPIKSRTDWLQFRRRLDPLTPGRLPANLEDLALQSRLRDYPLGMWVGGTYGVLRDWWGVEALSLLLYDDPALVEEMIDHLTHLCVENLRRVLAAGVELDWVMFWEDLAFKTGPLISPAQFTRYCLPYYAKVMDEVRRAGVPVAMVDSDGNIDAMIPLWLDAGITVMHPMEAASGMDVTRLRRQYGKRIGFFGGIDKRALAGTRQEIEAEVLPKLEECWAEGGFIPACDHAVPPDVSFDNYRYFRELVREAEAKVWGC